MNTKENQVLNLLLIEYIFSKKELIKQKNKTKKEGRDQALIEKSYVYMCL